MVSISGGKDSLAVALLALETQPPDSVELVHADTGHEHPDTVDYLDYLEGALGRPILRLRADFTQAMAQKRNTVLTVWPEQGVPDEVVRAAAALLEKPTGVPFFDMCLAAGRFPSQVARFCTRELKIEPITEHQLGLVEAGHWVWSWQGIRHDESRARRAMVEFEDLGGGVSIYRPILRWNAKDVFEAAKAKGIAPNPLYRQGMDRVGCMPCINASKDMLAEIAKRWPWVIDKLRRWEEVVSLAAKRGNATFFNRSIPVGTTFRNRDEIGVFNGIDATVDWARTSPGGKQYDLFKVGAPDTCSSAYGLCE